MVESREFVDQIDRQSLAILRSMLGETWGGFFANEPQQIPGHYLAWDSVGIQLDRSCVTVNNNINDLVIYDDFDTDVGHLEVETLHTYSSTDEDAKLHAPFAGQPIRDIHVVRSNVRCFIRGLLSWTLSSDFGLVIELDTGHVAIAKTMPGGVWLDVLVADALENIDLSMASRFWLNDDGDVEDPDTGERFEVRVALVPVRELVGD